MIWQKGTLATVLVAVILAAAVLAVVIRLIKNRKRGKCSCGCESCAFKDGCEKK